MCIVEILNYEVNNLYNVQEPAIIAAVDAAEAEQAEQAEQAEPIAGPSGLCSQRLDAAPLQDAIFTDAMEEVCTILDVFVSDCIRSRSCSLWRCI